jgi:hypothetical protein
MASSGIERPAQDGRSVVLTVVPGEPETGLWCGRCLLPSLIRVPLLALGAAGVTRLGTAEGCPGCLEESRL